MKLKGFVIGLGVTSLVGMGIFLNPQMAGANTWHKGAPKILKGYWYNKWQDRLAVSNRGVYITPKVGAAVSRYRH